MNIYFSCSITGGRNDQPVYRRLVKALLEDGHTVPTANLADENITVQEGIVEADEIYRRDVGWVTDCDVVVAEVSTPSHGVGYEIALAESLGKPVFCCYQNGSRVSKMILGNPSPLFYIYAYTTAEDAVESMRVFLKAAQNE